MLLTLSQRGWVKPGNKHESLGKVLLFYYFFNLLLFLFSYFYYIFITIAFTIKKSRMANMMTLIKVCDDFILSPSLSLTLLLMTLTAFSVNCPDLPIFTLDFALVDSLSLEDMMFINRTFYNNVPNCDGKTFLPDSKYFE